MQQNPSFVNPSVNLKSDLRIQRDDKICYVNTNKFVPHFIAVFVLWDRLNNRYRNRNDPLINLIQKIMESFARI